MMRAGWMALGLLLTSGAAFASAAGTTDDVLAALQRGIDRAQADDCAAAVSVLKGAVDAPAFGQLTPRQQYLAERILASCAFDIRDHPTAVRVSRLATASTFAEPSDWYVRFLSSYVSEDKTDASLTLEKIAATWPDVLHNLKLRTIYTALNDTAGKPEGDARNARILTSLFDAGWRPTEEPAEDADGLWFRLARYDLEAGRTDHARKVAAVITAPDEITDIRASKQFDAIVAADPARFDIAKAYVGSVARLKARVAKESGKLEPVVMLTGELYHLDRQDESLALIDATFAQIKAGKKFTDADDQLNWLHDRRSNVLMALGRADEAIAEMEAGSHLGESGTNVSQTINLADIYYSLGRPQDALKVLANFNPKHASPYGAMAAEQARTCAYAQLGDKAALAKSLAFGRAHADDAPGVAVEMLLCAGEEDEAAALTLKYLGAKDKRDDILEILHVGIVPAKMPERPFATLMRTRWIALARRTEIVKAVEVFGHILDLPIVKW